MSIRPDDIVAYTYKADTYCVRCIAGKVVSKVITLYEAAESEKFLDTVAEARGIDRYDERSFDSDDFPKVVFRDQLEPDEEGESERCGGCSGVLEEVW